MTPPDQRKALEVARDFEGRAEAATGT